MNVILHAASMMNIYSLVMLKVIWTISVLKVDSIEEVREGP